MTDINEHEDEQATDAVAQAEPEIIEEPKPARKNKPRPAVAVADAVVGGGATDDVFLERCVFENIYARKSLTIHHLQRRLTELGYTSANDDKDGWYGQSTRDAVAAWQRDNDVEGDGLIDAKTFLAIFDGDPNVTPHV